MKKMAAMMLLSLILVFTSCSKEEQRYSLNIISRDYSCIFDYYTTTAAPNTGNEEATDEVLEEREDTSAEEEVVPEEIPAESESETGTASSDMILIGSQIGSHGGSGLHMSVHIAFGLLCLILFMWIRKNVITARAKVVP